MFNVKQLIHDKTKNWAPYHEDGPMLVKKTASQPLPSAHVTLDELPAFVTWKLQHVAEILHEVYFNLKGTSELNQFAPELIESINEIRYMEDVWRHFCQHIKSKLHEDYLRDTKSIIQNFLKDTKPNSITDLENLCGIDEDVDNDEDTFDLTEEMEFTTDDEQFTNFIIDEDYDSCNEIQEF